MDLISEVSPIPGCIYLLSYSLDTRVCWFETDMTEVSVDSFKKEFLIKRTGTTASFIHRHKNKQHALSPAAPSAPLPFSWRPLLSFLSQSTCRGIHRIECNHRQGLQQLQLVKSTRKQPEKNELTCLLCLHLAERKKKKGH